MAEHEYQNQIVKLVPLEYTKKKKSYEGRLAAVFYHQDRLWDYALLSGNDEKFYLTDYSIVPVELDGRRLPELPGVYRFFGGGHGSTNVQLTREGAFFPFPYHFSGWRESELFQYPQWESMPDKELDYPEILNPELADRVRYLEKQMNKLTGVDSAEVAALARKLVLKKNF